VLVFALLRVVRIFDWFIQKCGPYLLSKILRARCHCFSIKKWSSFFLSFSVYFSFSRALYYFFAVLLLLLLLFVLLLIIIDADGCRRLMPLFNAGLVAIVAATASSSEAESAL